MRLRPFLSFAVVVIISIAGVTLLAHQRVMREVNQYMFRGGMYGAEEIVRSLEDYFREHGYWNGVETILPAGHSMGQGMGGMMAQRLRLADEQGRVFVDTAGSPGERLSKDDLGRAVLLQVDDRVVGYLLLANGANFTTTDSHALLYRWNRAILIAALVGGVISLLLAWLLAYGLLRPVRELTGASNALACGDLTQRVVVRGSDEMAQLAQTFNYMAESLQQAEASRRALTADIAHELRTPLAVQRANLEAMQDGVFPLAPENLQSILDQNLLLTRLVNDLRTLALADAGQLDLERMPADLLVLVEGVVKRFKPDASARRVELFLDLPAKPLPLLPLDPLRLEQILHNLISNALRYTPDGGFITCGLSDVQPGSRSVAFTIHDSGPGIPVEELPHIFDRFYRVDKARSRAEGGSGLGLAIARQLAEAHGGSLTADNHSQGGAIFTLILPISRPHPQFSHETE